MASCLQKRTIPINKNVCFDEMTTIVHFDIKTETKSSMEVTKSKTIKIQLEPLSSRQYDALGLCPEGLRMSYGNKFNPFHNISSYIQYPNIIKYEIMIDGLQEETFLTKNDAMFRIYEILYHHLQLCDIDDHTFNPLRHWIIDTGLEYGFDSLIENQLNSLRNIEYIQASDDKLCRFCGNELNHFFVNVMKSIPRINTIMPDKYRGKTLLFKFCEVRTLLDSIDAWYNIQSSTLCKNLETDSGSDSGSKSKTSVSKTIIKSMAECMIYENCPCVLFKKWNL